MRPCCVWPAVPLQAKGAYLWLTRRLPATASPPNWRYADQHPLEALKGWFFGDPTVLPKDAKDVVDAQLDAKGELRRGYTVRGG